MRQGRTGVLALLLLLAGVAGCIGGEEAPTDQSIESQSQDDPTAASDQVGKEDGSAEETVDTGTTTATQGEDEGSDTTDDPPVVDRVPYRFNHKALDLTFEEQGTFRPAETCYLPAEPTCQTHIKELTQLLPPGDPVRIDAWVTFTSTGEAEVSLDILAPPGTVYDRGEGYAQDQGTPPATSTTNTSAYALVVPDGQPVQVQVEPALPDPGQELDYTLTIQVTSSAKALPTSLPIEVPLQGPDRSLWLDRSGPETTEAIDGDGSDGNATTARIMVWDPDDRFVGHTTLQVPGELDLNMTTSGDHVIMLAPDAPEDLVLMTSEGAGNLELGALTYTDERGPPNQGLPEESINWSFEVDRVPISAGIYANGTEGPAADQDWDARLGSPAGNLIDASRTGGRVYIGTGAHEIHWFSVFGDEHLVPGTYEAGANGIWTGPSQAGEVLVHYVR